MKINSPVTVITDVLEQINENAKKHEAKLRTNEAATRTVLIDPILKALGWDISNPEMVEMEKTYGDTRLDYGLLDSSGKVQVIVEAKSLGTNLSDVKITAKLFTYGFTYGIQNIILTDGIIWQHYQQVAPGKIAPEIIDISSDPALKSADFFISKLDAARFWFTIPEIITPPPPVIEARDSIPLVSLSPNSLKDKKPKSLILPDGSTVAISHWRDILFECTKFVLKVSLEIPIPLPDKAGKKISLLNSIKPSNGVAYVEMSYKGRIVYLYINYDAGNCIANAKYILNFLPKGTTWQAVEVDF